MKRREMKKIKQVEIIEDNYDLVLALIKIFHGQVLSVDLEEFCISYDICTDSSEYDSIVKSLIKNDVIRFKKFRDTQMNVIIACRPLTNYFQLESIKYSIETVMRNSYINHILRTRFAKTKNIEHLVEQIEKNTTLLSLQRVVNSCYKEFMIQTSIGEDARIEAIHREEKRKTHLKNNKKEELITIEYTHQYSMQTLREREIFLSKSEKDGRYTLYILDLKSTHTLSKIAEKIAMALYLLSFHLELTNEEYRKLDILVLTRDEKSKKKLENTFIMNYSGGQKINIDRVINEKARKLYNNIKSDFQYARKFEDNDVYLLKNPYGEFSSAFLSLRIKVESANTEEKHNSSAKASRLVEYRKNIEREKMKEEIYQELREKGLLVSSENL